MKSCEYQLEKHGIMTPISEEVNGVSLEILDPL